MRLFISFMIRFFDLILSFFGLLLSFPILLILWVVCWFDTRSPIFRQVRVGRYQQPFIMLKFRTMQADTASIATHLVDSSAITHFGYFLRRTKLDELPQLYNVLMGDMSLVGPRPCIFNQYELIAERDRRGVFDVRPGITGLGQIQRIDMSTPVLLASKDAEMLKSLSLYNYFRFIFITIVGRAFIG
jgi:O-antigen biosynthesis protein WbqP